MASNQSAVRYPWVALALSFLSSGVGHLYCGRIAKGLFLYSARFLLPLLCVVAAFVRPSNAVLIGLILVPTAATLVIYFYSAIDAFAIAKRVRPDYRLKEYNRTSLYWLLIMMQLAYPVALTWGIRQFLYEPFLIPTRSMSPNFLSGDRILVNKRPFNDDFPKRSDVIVFRTPSSEEGRVWIKRVIGVAGDKVVIDGREVKVNGKTLDRERLPADSTVAIRNQVPGKVYEESQSGRRYQVHFNDDSLSNQAAETFEVTVPDRSVFVLGDNRDRSRDSRHIGAIHVGDVIGYVDYNYFPAETWSRFGVYQD